MSQRQKHSILQRNGVVQRRGRLLSATAAVAVAALVGAAQAQTVWVGPATGSGAWEDPANWTAGVPNGGVAFVNNGGTATIGSTVPEALALQVGADAGFSGTVVQNDGLLPLTQLLVLGGSANTAPTAAGVGTYIMNGGTLTDADNSVGDKGAGTFIMNGGVLSTTGHMRLGNDIGSSGVLFMHGGQITLGQYLLVGHFSPAGETHITTGTLNMDGGTLTVQFLNLGQHPNALGTIHQTGGFIDNKAAFTDAGNANVVLGEISRQPNLYDMSGGTLHAESSGTNTVGGTVFCGSSAGIGEFRVSGNAVAQIDGHIFAGSGATAIGTFSMSDNAVVSLGLNKVGGGFWVNGDRGMGTGTISGGTFTADFIQNGRQTTPDFPSSQGQITQTGGSVTVRRSITVGGLSGLDNFYDISGGTLNVTNDLSAGTLNDSQSGVHVARFSVNPGTFSAVTNYSKGRLTIGGNAAVNIAGGLYNSTGFTGVITVGTGTQTVDLPGGQGLVEMKGGTLSAGSFLNGGQANAGSFNNGGASAVYNQTGGVATVGAVTGTGTVNVSGGVMNVSSISQSGANVSASGAVNVAPNGTTAATSRVNNLSISGNGKLDLADNSLIVDYSGSSPLSAIQGNISSAYAGGAWTGNGLTSSNAAANASAAHKTALGYAEASAIGLGGGTFSGQSVDNDAVLVRYTYSGDANLDGKVDTLDFNSLAANFGGTDKVWSQADFNFDNKVDTLDFNNLAANFGQSLPASSEARAGALVPEPIGLPALAVCAAMFTARRNRRRRHARQD